MKLRVPLQTVDQLQLHPVCGKFHAFPGIADELRGVLRRENAADHQGLDPIHMLSSAARFAAAVFAAAYIPLMAGFLKIYRETGEEGFTYDS